MGGNRIYVGERNVKKNIERINNIKIHEREIERERKRERERE